MLRKIFPLAVFFAFVGPSFALTEPGKDALKKATTAMRAELEAKPVSKDDESAVRGRQNMFSMIGKLEAAVELPASQVEGMLGIYGSYFNSTEVADALGLLRNRVAGEKKEEEETEIGRLRELLSRAASGIRTAKAPEELDDIIHQLAANGRKNESGYSGSLQPDPELRRLQAAIEPAKFFLEKWQDHISFKKASNIRAAKQALNEIRQSGRDFAMLMPRSELLALYNEVTYSREQVIVMITGIDSLEEIRPVVLKLQEIMANYDGSSYQPEEFVPPLASMDKIFREYQEGLPVAIELDYNTYARFPQEVASKLIGLRGELLKLVIPRYVGAPKGTEAGKEENVDDFLERLEVEALAREDARGASRVREARKILVRGSNFSGQDGIALNALISAQNQEAAGQFELAVISYQQALKSGSDLVPAKLIGERLQAIKSDQPAAYEKGVERFLTPPPNPMFPRMERPTGEIPGKTPPAILIPAPAQESSAKPVEPGKATDKK